MLEEKDPDDLIRERGVEAFKSLLVGSLPLWDVLWARETDGVDAKSPDTQAALKKKLNTLIRTIRELIRSNCLHSFMSLAASRLVLAGCQRWQVWLSLYVQVPV